MSDPLFLPAISPMMSLALIDARTFGVALIPWLAFLLLFFVLWGAVHHSLPRARDLLVRGGRWVASWAERSPGLRRWTRRLPGRFRAVRPFFGVIVLLLAGATVSVLAGALFLELAEHLRQESGVLRMIDDRASEIARGHRHDAVTVFFFVFTILGAPLILALLTAMVALLLVVRRQSDLAAYLVVTTAVGGLLNRLVKILYARARPELAESLAEATGYSFPSGHTMGSVMVLGAVAYVAVLQLPTWRVKSLVLALMATAVVAIGVSRIYLGVHWLSDIAAGLTAGIVWLIATTTAFEAVRRIRRLRAS